MFFGVSIIYMDLLETSAAAAAATSAPSTPTRAGTAPSADTKSSSTPAAPASPRVGHTVAQAAVTTTTRRSRSAFAVVVVGVALVMTAGLFCGFVWTIAPATVSAVTLLASRELWMSPATPWCVVGALVVLAVIRERKIRGSGGEIAKALRQQRVDDARAKTYPLE